MHGEAMNADDWVLNQGRLETLPFILANLGYDVWVGNNRGVDDYSRHQSLTDTDAAYWDFSYVEMGTLDLPAIIDTIKKETGLEQVTYIGYSRGNT
jgi:lysosomal acid lipase/cholesteryl ester hydrolase